MTSFLITLLGVAFAGKSDASDTQKLIAGAMISAGLSRAISKLEV